MPTCRRGHLRTAASCFTDKNGWFVCRVCRNQSRALRRKREGRRVRQDGFCKHGHRRTQRNTYIRPDDGSKECRICRSIVEKLRRDRRKQVHIQPIPFAAGSNQGDQI
jgi:hypothetical protein